MRIRVLSDLHLEFFECVPPAAEADVVVLAGDIHAGARGVEWARAHFPDTLVVYVPGNHEFYGGRLQDVMAVLRDTGERHGVNVLNGNEVTINGTRFLGATDISTEEFVNVGVVLHAPNLGYLQARMRTTCGRVSQVFPNLDGDAFMRTMVDVEKSVESAQRRLDDLLPEKAETALEFATRVLTRDDSSLQWSSLGSGRTRNPDRELDALFDKLVLRYEQGSAGQSSPSREPVPGVSKIAIKSPVVDLTSRLPHRAAESDQSLLKAVQARAAHLSDCLLRQP